MFEYDGDACVRACGSDPWICHVVVVVCVGACKCVYCLYGYVHVRVGSHSHGSAFSQLSKIIIWRCSSASLRLLFVCARDMVAWSAVPMHGFVPFWLSLWCFWTWLLHVPMLPRVSELPLFEWLLDGLVWLIGFFSMDLGVCMSFIVLVLSYICVHMLW
jgi:hypothetical protein